MFLGTLLNIACSDRFLARLPVNRRPEARSSQNSFDPGICLCFSEKGKRAPSGTRCARFFVPFLLCGISFAQTTYKFNGPARLPDPSVTPGVIRSTDVKEVCSTSTKQFRHTTAAMKAQVYKEYGQVNHKGVCKGAEGCEIDHLISLELGGADVVGNLWPQPYGEHPGAHEKDKVENYLRKEVCSGKMSLLDAQKQISTDWYEIYHNIQ